MVEACGGMGLGSIPGIATSIFNLASPNLISYLIWHLLHVLPIRDKTEILLRWRKILKTTQLNLHIASYVWFSWMFKVYAHYCSCKSKTHSENCVTQIYTENKINLTKDDKYYVYLYFNQACIKF